MIRERKEKLAIALADLDKAPAELIAGRLDLTSTIRASSDRKQEDVPAVVFTCDLLTAALICDIMRSNDRKHGTTPTRVYLNKDKTWSRVTFETVLTILFKGKARLNPAVFPNEVMMGEAPTRRCAFGGV